MANNPIEVVIARARIGDVDASLYADILEYLDVSRDTSTVITTEMTISGQERCLCFRYC